MLKRVVTIVLGAPLFLALAIWGPWPWTILVAALMCLALREFYAACRKIGADPSDGFGYAASLVMLVSAVPLLDSPGIARDPAPFAGRASAAFFYLAFTFLVIGSFIVELARRERSPLRNLGPTWLGVLYVGWLFPFAVRLRWLSPMQVVAVGWPAGSEPVWMTHLDVGAWMLLFVLLTTWTSDTAAYLAGRSFGRHKMAPALSPGKTWEGTAGGFAGTLVAAAVLGWVLHFPLGWSLTAGLLIGVAAPLGDLCESALKRELGVKDFGSLLPGHGGAFDRFDSLLFTAPVVYFLILLWARPQ